MGAATKHINRLLMEKRNTAGTEESIALVVENGEGRKENARRVPDGRAQ
jgi:hypothetical protein